MTFNELIDRVLTEIGEPVDGTGFYTRLDVLKVIDRIHREVSRDCRNVVTTTGKIEPAAAATYITVDANGNMLDVLSAYRTYGSITKDIFIYDIQQVNGYDSTWRDRTGAEIQGLLTGIYGEGILGLYPIPVDALNDIYVTYLKLATRVTAELTEAGDAASQLSAWYLTGITDSFIATGNILYWSLTNVDTTRTVKLYSNSAMTAGYLVAQGSRTGDGSITLAEQNDSGISGTVTVAFTIDDATSANTLTFATIETPVQDLGCLEYGIKAGVYNLERNGKNKDKHAENLNLYNEEKALVRSRAIARREGTYRTSQPRQEAREDIVWPTYIIS